MIFKMSDTIKTAINQKQLTCKVFHDFPKHQSELPNIAF